MRINVIVSALEVDANLYQTLDSVLSQEPGEFRLNVLLVCPSNSLSDAYKEAVRQITDSGSGVYSAMNMGLKSVYETSGKNAETDLVTFLSSGAKFEYSSALRDVSAFFCEIRSLGRSVVDGDK